MITKEYRPIKTKGNCAIHVTWISDCGQVHSVEPVPVTLNSTSYKGLTDLIEQVVADVSQNPVPLILPDIYSVDMSPKRDYDNENVEEIDEEEDNILDVMDFISRDY